MPVEYRKKLAVFQGMVTVEDAEALMVWAGNRTDLRVDFLRCEHLHPAALQILLAAGARVTAWPAQERLAQWLQSVLKSTSGGHS
jgi:hypothetical protein